LNIDLRPVTAKWHRAHKTGLLDSKDGANHFRVDLARLQVKLVAFCEALQIMAYGKQILGQNICRSDRRKNAFTASRAR
jgi:hypothetical protein